MGIQQLVQFIAQIAQMDGGESFDYLNKEGAIRELQDILNVPISVLNTPDVVAATQQARAQQQALAATMNAVPNIAGAVKDFAAAENLGKR